MFDSFILFIPTRYGPHGGYQRGIKLIRRSVINALNSQILRFPDPQIPRSHIPRSRDSQIPRSPDSRIPRFPDPKIPRSPDSQIPRFPDLDIHNTQVLSSAHFTWKSSSEFVLVFFLQKERSVADLDNRFIKDL